ncbi:MAG: vitamin B12 dependent-methionine synthase activation domain-containing protein [Candidatus Bathyarchaeia archaeon]
MKVLDPIPVQLNLEEFMRLPSTRRLREADVRQVMEKCRPLIEPKAVYTLLKVVSINGDEVLLSSGHTLKSIILSDMLKPEQSVAPYVVTIGSKLENHVSETTKYSILQAWIMERIGDYALEKTAAYIRSLIEKELGGSAISFGPGTGTGKLFSIDQQETLFRILDPPRNIGVHLTSSYLMVPRKSISGVLATTEKEYVACQYCPRERCENRRKPFSGEYFAIKCKGFSSLRDEYI